MIKKIIQKSLNRIIPGNKPNFIIAGAQKSGTTSLYYYLNQHPKLIGSTPKEVRFFNRDKNYEKGENWYKNAFKDYKKPLKKGLYFEATPEYLYRRSVAERIHDFDPSLKIIVILREPIKRAYSSWNMYRDFPIKFKGKLPGALSSEYGYVNDRQNNIVKELYKTDKFPSFEEVIASEMDKIENESELEEPSFIRRGIYLPQIKKYHELFGKDQVLVLGFNEFTENKIETLNKILLFLNIQKDNWTFLNGEKMNFRNYPQKIGTEMYKKLRDFYTPYNKALFEYLGKKIDW